MGGAAGTGQRGAGKQPAPRVLMLVNRFPALSSSFLVHKFLGLLDRGWDVHVVGKRAEVSDPESFPQLAARPDAAARIHAVAGLAKAMRRYHPSLVHAEFATLAQSGETLDALGETPIVVSFRGHDAVFAGLSDPAYYDLLWQRANAFHFVSGDVRRHALSRGCPEATPFAVIPSGVDTAYFDPGARRHRAVAGSPRRPLRVLTVARIHWQKGYEYALQAVRRVSDAGIRCEYRIIGGGRSDAELERLLFAIADLDLGHQVRLLGERPQEDVRDELRWADVVLHAAVAEGFSNAVAEAQAMRVPVVCADAQGLAENVADRVTGFVVARRNPTALAERLARLAASPELRDRMGKAGRRRVLSQFTLARAIDGYDRLYRDVLGVSEPPPKSG